jgi:mono/diheme cytochrome c family protein
MLRKLEARAPPSGLGGLTNGHFGITHLGTGAPYVGALDYHAARMATLGLILLFVVLGTGVIFIAYTGGLGAAREAYLTRGGTFFKIAIPLLYIGMAIAIPAVVIASHDAKQGSSGALANKPAEGKIEEGKALFMNTCASCHSLKAVNARGVMGPSLDSIGQVTEKRVIEAIKNGGTGQRLMPANLLQGESAAAVAAYVTETAGR